MGMLPNFIAKRPHVAEHDLSGFIVDANGSEFQNGQAVYGIIVPRTSFCLSLSDISDPICTISDLFDSCQIPQQNSNLRRNKAPSQSTLESPQNASCQSQNTSSPRRQLGSATQASQPTKPCSRRSSFNRAKACSSTAAVPPSACTPFRWPKPKAAPSLSQVRPRKKSSYDLWVPTTYVTSHPTISLIRL